MAYVGQNTHNMEIKTRDTNDTNVLTVTWNEDEGAADRTLNVKVNAGDRTLDMSGNLTVESASIVNQDLSSDKTGVAFGSLILGGAGATVAEFSTDGTMGGDGGSDTAVPTEKAVVTYVGTATAGIMAWTAISDDANAAENNGYIVNTHGDRVIVTMPTGTAVGKMIIVVGASANGWQVTCPAGDKIQMGNLITKAAGSLQSTDTHDVVAMVCVVTGAGTTVWKVVYAVGMINVETS